MSKQMKENIICSELFNSRTIKGDRWAVPRLIGRVLVGWEVWAWGYGTASGTCILGSDGKTERIVIA